ncbi:autotransporter domain-containing protein [Rhodovulum sp. YNF3179]|uniref:autotransporter domain-containing protein n=1 Tax=Rhodovulum sp. YNF3179 TaxID=3425127 RepID=UPI003D35911A
MFDQTYGLVPSPDDTGAFRGLHGKGKNPRFLSRSSGLALAAAARFTKASRRHSALALVALGLLGGTGPAWATCTISGGASSASGTLVPNSDDTVDCTASNAVSIDNEAATGVTVTVDGGAALEPTPPLSAINLGEGAKIFNDGIIVGKNTPRTGTIVIRDAGNRVVNRGSILSTNTEAIEGSLFANRTTGAVLENSGIISTTASGVSNVTAVTLAEKARVINSGDILLFSDGDGAPAALSVSSGSVIENEASGRIQARLSSSPVSGSVNGLSAVRIGEGAELNNAGTIEVIDVVGNARTSAVSVFGKGNIARIVNSGTIDASSGRDGIRSNDALRVENSGTIRGGTGVAVAISDGDGSSVLLQQGSSIDGDISVRSLASVRLTDAELGNNQQVIDFCNNNPDDSVCNRAVPNLPTTATLQLEGTGSEDDLISGFNVIEVRGDGTWTLDTALQAGSATDQFQTGDFRGPLEIDVQGAGGLLDLTGVISDNPDGTLAEVKKLGPGTLILTGTNTYTGGTEISAGTLQVGDGGNSGSITGDIANEGTLVFNRSRLLTYGGEISGSGGVEQAGTGVTVLTGANSYTGGTLISDGTLQIGVGGSIVGDVTNNSLLTFNQGANSTFGGDISGTGTVRKVNPTILFLTGTNTYTGGTEIRDGTVQIAGGGSIVGDVSNNGLLTFNQAKDSTFSGIISGTGGVKKVGANTLTLTGDSSGFAGTTTVDGGTLAIQNKLGGDVSVMPGGTLAGNGSVGGLDASGTISPGTSIGTLTVNGDAAFRAGSTLLAEVDPAAVQNADRLAVNGDVTGIDDLTIEVVPLSPGLTAADYVAANTYTVLTAAGSIDGDNPGIQLDGGLPALVDVNVVGTPSADGQVELNFTDITLGQLSKKAKVQTGSKNHATVVGAIANTATTAPTTPLPSSTTTTVGQAVQTLTNAQLAQLNDVHIEPFSSYQSVSLEDYDMVAGIVLSEAGGAGLSFGGISAPAQLAAATQDVDVTRGPIAAPGADRGVWGSLAFVDGTVDGKAGVGSFDYSVKGLVLGADLVSDGVMRAGVFGALNRMELGEHDTVDQVIEGDSYHVGAYGSWQRGDGLTLSGVVGYAFGDHESTRVVPDVGGFTGGTARAEFDSRGFYIGAEAAQRFDLTGGVAVTPSVSAIFAQVTQDGATESGGGDFNFALDESTADSLMTTVGLTAERRMETASGSWKLLGSAHYHYDWLAAEDAFHDITASNPITGTITQVGQNRGAHGLTAGLGISGQLTESIAVGAGYAYGWNEDGEEHALSASFSMTW